MLTALIEKLEPETALEILKQIVLFEKGRLLTAEMVLRIQQYVQK